VLAVFEDAYMYSSKVKKYFVRVHDYSTHGDDLLQRMVEGGSASIQPKKLIDAMRLWVQGSAESGGGACRTQQQWACLGLYHSGCVCAPGAPGRINIKIIDPSPES